VYNFEVTTGTFLNNETSIYLPAEMCLVALSSALTIWLRAVLHLDTALVLRAFMTEGWCTNRKIGATGTTTPWPYLPSHDHPRGAVATDGGGATG
jgi:hypothetical protein